MNLRLARCLRTTGSVSAHSRLPASARAPCRFFSDCGCRGAQRRVRCSSRHFRAQVAPALSPDGRFLAFSSRGPEEAGKADIWIEDVDREGLRRLTDTPEETETSPAWSPDARLIAYVRDGKGVFVVPQQGGAERRVSPSGTWVEWGPDGASVLVRDRDGGGPYGVWQVSLDTLERRQLTRPRQAMATGDSALRPTGRVWRSSGMSNRVWATCMCRPWAGARLGA